MPAAEATRMLRGITHPDTLLIVIAADDSAQSVRACYRAGATDYLAKPLSAALAREAAAMALADPDAPPPPARGAGWWRAAEPRGWGSPRSP